MVNVASLPIVRAAGLRRGIVAEMMRRQGPDPEGIPLRQPKPPPWRLWSRRRLRGLREEDCSPGAEGPGRTHPRNRHEGSGSEPSVRSAWRSGHPPPARGKFPREPSPLAWVSAQPLVWPDGPVLRPGHRICRSGRRVTGNHRVTSRPPVPYPCRPAEASAPAAAKQRSHEPRCHSPKAPRAPQQRACVSCEISVHKDAKAAQLIPSFLHNSKHDGGHAEFRWSQGRLLALT